MDRHSTIVVWAKTLLPLAALGLLSTLFLISRPPSIEDTAVPFADIEALAREQRISAPAFAGVADDGSIIELRAESARPGTASDDDELIVERISGSVTAPGGDVMTLDAGAGRIDTLTGLAVLSDGVRVQTRAGYDVQTEGLTADLDTGRMESAGALSARTPYGRLEAGRMIAETPEGGGARLLFTEGVHLTYRPEPTEEPQP